MNKTVLFFFALSLALSIYEFLAILRARIQNKTKNTQRVIIRGLVFVMLTVLLVQYWTWQRYIASFDHLVAGEPNVTNTPFLICIIVIGLILSLVLLEIMGLYKAKKMGLTKNTSRLVTSVVVLFCLFPILNATVVMWDVYVEKLTSGRWLMDPPSAEMQLKMQKYHSLDGF